MEYAQEMKKGHEKEKILEGKEKEKGNVGSKMPHMRSRGYPRRKEKKY
jgi:hypothetical protein